MSDRPGFDTTDPRLAHVAWSRIVEPGDVPAGALIRMLGPVTALDWLSSGSDQPPVAEHPGWRAAAARWRPRLAGLDPRRELDVLRRLGGRLLLPGDEDWPSVMDDLGDAAPLCLWVRGPGDLLDLGTRSVAVVGARASTAYGEHVTRDLVAGLCERGHPVISGGAFGIDGAAHRAALMANGSTAAVMAGGIDRLYPVAHTELLESIAHDGAVISEAPPGTAPMRQRFLARNRLIAALGRATVVVEAAWRSGALNTARHAAALLRPVGAVPGPVTSMASAGCHRLLREGAAVCITDAAEVLELVGALGDEHPREPPVPASLLDGLAPDEARVLDALPRRAAAEVDNLIRASGLSPSAALAALGSLELAGRVVRTGSRWRRSET